MKIKSLITNSLFFKSARLARQNPGKIVLMVLFDVLFLASAFVLHILFAYIAKSLYLPQAESSFYISLTLTLIYYLTLLSVYSFFKYSTLSFVKSMFSKTKFSFSAFGKFFFLNITLAGIFFIASLLAGLILMNIKQPYQIFAYFVIASPYWTAYNPYSLFSLHSLLFYAAINLSQSFFYENNSLKNSLKSGFKEVLPKLRVAKGIILPAIISGIALALLLSGIGYFVRNLSGNYAFYLTAYSYFSIFSTWAVVGCAYLLMIINRISFYILARKG